jgi:AAA15 family ATPase/GTPase
MLKHVQIQNFRCFESLTIENFERVNLIGGKNNSGKTCLLEAIGCLSDKFSYTELFSLRKSDINSVIYKHFTIDKLFVKSGYNGNEVKFESDISGAVLGSAETGRKTMGLNIDFISQKSELPQLNILKSFDEFDARLLKHKLIDILKLADSRITDMRTFKTKEGLWLQPNNEEYEPLSNYGDATTNLIRYFTPVFEKELYNSSEKNFSILLIDEIENGIHYTVHYEFWKTIFKLSKQLNVQVYATTHSLEMIQQFNKVAREEGGGAYFEMNREYETGKLFAEKHNSELLEYELLKEESTFRGE